MKVKRMKNGYSIRCSDSEFDALQVAVASMDPKGLSGNAKAGYTRRTNGGKFLRVDVDKRVS